MRGIQKLKSKDPLPNSSTKALAHFGPFSPTLVSERRVACAQRLGDHHAAGVVKPHGVGWKCCCYQLRFG